MVEAGGHLIRFYCIKYQHKHGDIENKINKSSYLFKRRQREKITGDTLYILHKKKSVAGKLEGYKNEMNLKLLNIHELHKWEW